MRERPEAGRWVDTTRSPRMVGWPVDHETGSYRSGRVHRPERRARATAAGARGGVEARRALVRDARASRSQLRADGGAAPGTQLRGLVGCGAEPADGA